MAEPKLTRRGMDSPCRFLAGIGLVSAAPRVRFRLLCAGDPAFFEISTSASQLWTTPARVLSRTLVSIEPLFGPESLVTTSAATGKLLRAAECS